VRSVGMTKQAKISQRNNLAVENCLSTRPPTSLDRNAVWHGVVGDSAGYSYKFQVSSKLAVRFASCVGSKIALSNCTNVHAVMALDIMADTVKR